MDAYISEVQITTCDEVEEFNMEVIQPGHRTICNAMANLAINSKRKHTKCVKAKLDSCGSVSIAHSNLMNEIKPATGRKIQPSIDKATRHRRENEFTKQSRKAKNKADSEQAL